jgi:hypothetical protein
MVNEEIKQNAEEYASHKLNWSRKRHNENPYLAWKEGFEDGAHSRDEEIEMLQNQIEELSEQLKMNAENIQKLRNPWISVEERLPEEGKCVFVRTVAGSYSVGQYIYPQWYITGIPSAHGLVSITQWMPILELRKSNNYGNNK